MTPPGRVRGDRDLVVVLALLAHEQPPAALAALDRELAMAMVPAVGSPAAGVPAAGVPAASQAALVAALEGQLVAHGLAPGTAATARERLHGHAVASGLARLPETSRLLAASGLLPSSDPAVTRLEVSLMGLPLVRATRGLLAAEARWPMRRCGELLAFVATSPGGEAARQAVVDAFWPDADAELVRLNLNPTLSHLRRGLERALAAVRPTRAAEPADAAAGGDIGQLATIVVEGGLVRLSGTIDWWIDAVEIERLATLGSRAEAVGELATAAELWSQARQLYRGPLLAGVDAAWVEPRRQALRRLYTALLRDLGTVLTRLDRPQEALDAYRQSLLEEPLQEAVHSAVMGLYARLGRRDLVRRQFQRLCSLLFDDLGVEPMAETTEEYHRLMA
jgi:DNA-binding SARP family transcriptional activator